MQQLQPNTTLQGGKYRIERVLGQGGFGITYLARNTVFDTDVAIKEFFMKDENERDGSSVTMPNSTKTELFAGQKEKFKKEAKRMFSIKNEHIIGVHDLFEENGTAYYVMDYVDGDKLSQRMKRTGKPMSEKKVRELLPQILSALSEVHQNGFWHLDLKPANIMLDKSGQIRLIDFGASKQLNSQKGGATTSTAICYTNGFAPREQMEQNYDKFGPWTDIYALGATLYCLLTNKRPPLPTDIDDDINEDKHESLPFPASVSNEMKELVLSMLKTNRLQRPQSVGDIVSHMEKKLTTKTAMKKKATPKTTSKEPQSRDSEEVGEVTIIGNGDDTIIDPVVAPIKPKEVSHSAPEVDLSFLDDMEETWKDKLWSYLTDLKNIGLIFAFLIGISIIRNLITCDGISNLFSNNVKEFSVLFEKSNNPNLSEAEKAKVVKDIEALANKGYGPAMFLLGAIVHDNDSLKATEIFKEAANALIKDADKGDSYAHYFLGNCYFSALGVGQDIEKALNLYEQAAKENIPQAQQALGWCYVNGQGVSPNYEKGKEWLVKAANSGNPKSILTLGIVVEEFEGDSLKAFDCYKKAADLGDVVGMCWTGSYYLNGNAINQDMVKALDYYSKAAERGSGEGAYYAGLICYRGYQWDSRLEKDLDKAIEYFDYAVTRYDNPDVQYQLGMCYWDKSEHQKAFSHFKIAANREHPAAQYYLYLCYCHGAGTEENQKLARQWRKKAIENGYQE